MLEGLRVVWGKLTVEEQAELGRELDKMFQEEIDREIISMLREQNKNDLAADFAKLQATCTHPNLEKTYKSNTGNYDPTADSYWIEFRCPDCRARWNEDQK